MAPSVPPYVFQFTPLNPGIYQFDENGGISPGYFDYSDLRVFNGTCVPTHQDYLSFGPSMTADFFDSSIYGDFAMLNRQTCAKVANTKLQLSPYTDYPYNIDITS